MKRRPLRPGLKPLERRARLRPVNPARRARLRAEQFGPEGEWMRDLPCATCPHMPPSEPSHIKTRGSGGKRRHLLPQCAECHRELHDDGPETFQARRPGCHLVIEARHYAARWEALGAATRVYYERMFRERYPAAARLLDKGGAQHGP